MAWEALNDEKDDLQLDESQQRQLGEQKRRSALDLKEAVWNAYRHVVFLGKDGALRHLDLGLIHSSSATDGLVGLIISRLKQDGEIEPEPSAGFLARNWPTALAEWPTKAVRDAFFASPLFPRLIDPDAVRRTIAKGVGEGLFGYAGKDAGGNYVGLRFKRPTSEADVEISEGVMLLPKETAEALASGAQPPEYQKPQPETAVGRETVTPDEDWLKTEAAAQPVGLRGLLWEGEVPWGKWMQFYNKVLSRFTPLGGVKLTVKAEIKPPEGVSPQKASETKAALRDLGLDDTVSPVE